MRGRDESGGCGERGMFFIASPGVAYGHTLGVMQLALSFRDTYLDIRWEKRIWRSGDTYSVL